MNMALALYFQLNSQYMTPNTKQKTETINSHTHTVYQQTINKIRVSPNSRGKKITANKVKYVDAMRLAQMVFS